MKTAAIFFVFLLVVGYFLFLLNPPCTFGAVCQKNPLAIQQEAPIICAKRLIFGQSQQKQLDKFLSKKDKTKQEKKITSRLVVYYYIEKVNFILLLLGESPEDFLDEATMQIDLDKDNLRSSAGIDLDPAEDIFSWLKNCQKEDPKKLKKVFLELNRIFEIIGACPPIDP